MATLYSRFALRRLSDALPIRRAGAEWASGIKKVFCDVSGHFLRGAVAKRRHFGIPGAALAAVWLVGCAAAGAGTPVAKADARDVVAARVQGRWAALIKGDMEAAYAYLSPASKETMPLDLYKAKHRAGMYRSVKIDSVECESDTCTVRLELTYDYRRTKGIVTPLTEKWIITQGQAWFVDRG